MVKHPAEGGEGGEWGRGGGGEGAGEVNTLQIYVNIYASIFFLAINF